jgi:hypothetical protein
MVISCFKETENPSLIKYVCVTNYGRHRWEDSNKINCKNSAASGEGPVPEFCEHDDEL